MRLFTVTEMASGKTAYIYPGHVFYCRINEALGATIVVSQGGAFVPCKEPLDEVLQRWQDAMNNKPEAPAASPASPVGT